MQFGKLFGSRSENELGDWILRRPFDTDSISQPFLENERAQDVQLQVQVLPSSKFNWK